MPAMLGHSEIRSVDRNDSVITVWTTSCTVYSISRHGVKYKVADIQWRVKEAAFQGGQINEASHPKCYGGRDTGLVACYKVSPDLRSGKSRRHQTILIKRCCFLQALSIRHEEIP